MMQTKKAILVTGGAGYIGSHMVRWLQINGYDPIVLDNLSFGTRDSIGDAKFFFGNVGDEQLIETIYQQYPFTAVMHFAAFIQVGESVKNPLKYYDNNVSATIKFLKKLTQLGVKEFIFSSSAAVYGNPQSMALVDEDHATRPINPYGHSKLIVENILKDTSNTHQMKTICLRYFNVAGGDPTISAGKRQIPPTNLIPIVLRAALTNNIVEIFGDDYQTPDGTCVRDYIHVQDICQAHAVALNSVATQQQSFRLFNLGAGKGHSVLEVIKAAETIIQKNIPWKIVARREGDPPMLVANPTRIEKELGWKAIDSNLNIIMQHAWDYERQRYHAAVPLTP